MPLLLLTAIALLQWLTMHSINYFQLTVVELDYTTFLLGNLQIIAIIAIWRFINKYIKIGDYNEL